jgi:carboxymethylenebutenolidase
MPSEMVRLRTNDGECATHVFQPEGDGQLPAVLMFMDGLGIRPALFEIAQRLADAGYYVMLPDLYYRSGYTASDAASLFTDAAVRADWSERVLPTVTIAKIMADMPAFLSHLDATANVRQGRIGITGYCLGGRLCLAAAGHFGDRIAATPSYHGSRLATDDPDSPHRLAGAMKARVYVAGAVEIITMGTASRSELADLSLQTQRLHRLNLRRRSRRQRARHQRHDGKYDHRHHVRCRIVRRRPNEQ